jgi:uncharacterized protein involved in exopolysaccharide biosynthesis/Mrp family chromosome partitioning ATPase
MAANDVIDLKRLYLVVRRHQRLAGGILCGFVILTLLYIMLATPQYRATARLLVDKSVTQTVSDISSIKKTGFETQALESEIEIIKSQGIAKTAFQILKTKGYFKDIGDDEKDVENALHSMAHGLDVTLIKDTYVFTITYTSNDPQKSADFANAYAQAYIQDQISILSQISTRTITWLHAKINEINTQSADVRKKLTAYRAAYNKSQRENLDSNASPLETGQKPLPGETESANSEKTLTDIGLREMEVLEQEIETYDTLYNFYLEKLKTIGVQETFPLTETRVITEATPPAEKSHPKALLLLAAALVFGTGTGLVLALLLDSLDSTLRRAGQIRRELDLPFLGFFPGRQNAHISNATFVSKSGAYYNFILPDSSVAEPSSLYSEVTRTIVNATDSTIAPGGKKVIGVVSSDSGDARRFVAANLASFIALSSSCLLINADLRANDSKPRGIGGFKDILTRTGNMAETILRLKNGNLSLLESFAADLDDTLPYLTPAHVRVMVESLRAQFDNIVIIMPDLLMPAEACSFAGSVDSFIVVAEWGKTLPNELNFHLAQNKLDPAKILGVVLENADMKKMEKFYGHKISRI